MTLTREEAAERLEKYNRCIFKDVPDGPALQEALRMGAEALRRAAELEAEREKLKEWVAALFEEADGRWRKSPDDYREGRRDTLEDIRDYIYGYGDEPPEVKDE